MRALLLPFLVLVLLAPAAHAIRECADGPCSCSDADTDVEVAQTGAAHSSGTGITVVGVDGTFYVISGGGYGTAYVYEESNGVPGPQRGDEVSNGSWSDGCWTHTSNDSPSPDTDLF